MARQHRFHGDPGRFGVVADFVADTFGRDIRYIADVAGGQGFLSRLLNKRGYRAEVIDPRGWTMVGVESRAEEYTAEMAGYYDLVIGLHPDQALRAVAESGVVRPTLVVPCCNFWSADEKLGRDALLDELSRFFAAAHVAHDRVTLDFHGPQNVGLLTQP